MRLRVPMPLPTGAVLRELCLMDVVSVEAPFFVRVPRVRDSTHDRGGAMESLAQTKNNDCA